MYEPIIIGDKPKYPVFKAVNGRLIPGFGPKEVATLVIMIIVAAVVFFTLGSIKVEQAVPLSERRSVELSNSFVEMRNAVYTQDQIAKETEGETPLYVDENTGARYTHLDDKRMNELLLEAEKHGITSDMDKATLESLLPKEEIIEVESTPPLVRGVVLFVPVLLFAGICVEIENGISLRGEITRYLKSRRQQKVYLFRSCYYE